MTVFVPTLLIIGFTLLWAIALSCGLSAEEIIVIEVIYLFNVAIEGGVMYSSHYNQKDKMKKQLSAIFTALSSMTALYCVIYDTYMNVLKRRPKLRRI